MHSLLLAAPATDNKHVVFGKVVQGLDVVRAVEAVGSQSGKTSQKVGGVYTHIHVCIYYIQCATYEFTSSCYVYRVALRFLFYISDLFFLLSHAR